MKAFIYPITALILGLSMILSALILKGDFTKPKPSNTTSVKLSDLAIPDPNLMTKKQLSIYLQLSEKQIDQILKEDKFKRAELGDSGYNTYQFLPYLKIDNQYRFLKTEVEQWLQYQNDHHVELENPPS